MNTNIRQQFPFFQYDPHVAYLDSAASALVPQLVIDKITEVYTKYPVNIHRGLYESSVKSTQEYDQARLTVANFLSVNAEEIIFTSGATAGINQLSLMLENQLQKGDEIVLLRSEHHANLLPWQRLAQKTGAILQFIAVSSEGVVDLLDARKIIQNKTKLVAISGMSNVFGTISPLKEISALCQKVSARFIVDASQLVVHGPIDCKKIGVDALVFSGHKLYGPSGVGVLYVCKNFGKTLPPAFVGGDMVAAVSYNGAQWKEMPQKFEAGTPPIAQAIGLAAAINFIQKIGWKNIQKHEQRMTQKLISMLKKEGAKIIGPETKKGRGGVVSFTLENIHPHDIAEVCGNMGVAIRSGTHCAWPVHDWFSILATARASVGIYTVEEDIKRLRESLIKAKKIFG